MLHYIAILASLTSPSFQKVLVLSKDNFETELAENKNLFVKFFAPWCGHCKQLAPIWEELDGTIKDVTVAEVDCTVETDICSKYGVQGYPTLKFLQHSGEVIDYDGARGKEDLSKWAQAMLLPSLVEYKSLDDLRAAARASGERFFFAIQDKVDSLDEAIKKFEKYFSTIKGKHMVGFVKGAEQKLTAFRDGAVIDFKGTFGDKAIKDFLNEHRFDFLPNLGPENFRDLVSKPGKNLVMIIHKPGEAGSPSLKLGSLAKKLALQDSTVEHLAYIAKKYTLSMLDGVQWKQFIEQFEITEDDLPYAVIFDPNVKREYFKAKIGTDAVASLDKFLADHKKGLLKGTSLDKEEDAKKAEKAAKKAAKEAEKEATRETRKVNGETYTPPAGSPVDRLVETLREVVSENFAAVAAVVVIGLSILISVIVGCLRSGKAGDDQDKKSCSSKKKGCEDKKCASKKPADKGEVTDEKTSKK